MKRYLCILFLLFGYFIFRGDCVLASGVARLVKVVYYGASDFSTAYAYDANGNMTKDLNRGIESITYDWNNMPREITFTSGAKTRYTYDAAGRKLRAEYITPLAASANYALGPTPPIVPPLTLYDLSTVDYHGDCVLRNDSLERVLTPNGYIASDTLHYYIKDYQGNVRCVVRHDGTLVESNEYYPYGGLFSATASTQPYKYGAKELDRTHGLDLYDSQARWYDSLLGRTSTMDPLAEKYYSLSPYLWCVGNPVRFVDPDGNNAIVVVDGKEITIRVNIYIQGASEELIKQYYDNIMQNWGVYTNYTDILTGDIYSLKWDINVQSVMSQDDVDFDNPANNYYLAIRGKSKVTDTNRGKIRTDFSVRPNPMAHEFGHNLGLRDRYENDDYYAVPHSKGNIMAEEAGKGVVSVSNIQTIVQPALFDHSIRNFGRIKRNTIYYINKQIREPIIRKHK